MTAGSSVSGAGDPGGRQVFRSPAAVAIWWLWVLFAAGNLVDLAVQGRDHLSVVAAFILVLVTGVVYVTALRPRVIVDPGGLTISNPVRDHRIGWAAVTHADSTDLLRVRCEWPEGDQTAKRVIYAWAVHSSRRRQVMAERRAARQARGAGRGFGIGARAGGSPASGGYASRPDVPEPVSLGVDAGLVASTLTTRAEQARAEHARADEPAGRPAAPLSSWSWTAVAAIVLPALALLIAVLA